jgi:hypothetical protein
MKVTIVNAENRVIVDGVQKPNIDCSALPAYVSVIQWDEASSSGWIEFVNDGHGVFLPNVKIIDFAPYRHLVQAWEAVG